MMEPEVYYAEVLLPLHLPGTYTYRIPRELSEAIVPGVRVVVQFGKHHLYSGVVRCVHKQAPRWQSKYILGVLDDRPLLEERHMAFWEWMARYYMCYAGDVMQVALPAGLKLASKSTVAIHPDFDGELSRMGKYERQVLDLLSLHSTMTVDDVSRAIGISKIMPLLQGMIEAKVLVMDEDLGQRHAPRKSAYVVMAEHYRDERAVQALLGELEQKKRYKQVELMLQYLRMSDFGKKAVAKRDLPKESALQTLIKNGVLEIEERVESSVHAGYDDSVQKNASDIILNTQQQAAYDAMTAEGAPAAFLLHGVTSSGKTEVYIKLIDREIRAGHQVLFLLPEIALTAQVIHRLRKYFGDSVGVYHSRFSSSQRMEVWQRTARRGADRYQVLLGARSAVFLPFSDLSLVIVDEEHDGSYKQFDPAPRYNARDAAVYLASLWKAKVVLGSATPSIESYSNASAGKYGLAVMSERYGGYNLPSVECVDMRAASQQGQLHGDFSEKLLSEIQRALNANQQVVLFQNRRGFALRIECDDCHHVPQCIHCDVSLVYHKSTSSLRCHYCGYSIPVPTECPACHSTHLHMTGIGTERVEDDIQVLFPNARVGRMDLDTTTKKNQYTEIINDFAAHKIDILVGTQMITKGLDFDNVSVVGIVNADNIINYPDFRSYERAFQQMTQVSGRAGRHQDCGKVIIQTYNPNHIVLHRIIDNDYMGMYADQDIERRVFRYPPYYKLIEVTLKHKEQEMVNTAAAWFADQLKATFGNRVMGPEYPLVSRIRALYLKTVIVRFERTEPIADAKRIILLVADKMWQQAEWKSVLIQFNVDPY